MPDPQPILRSTLVLAVSLLVACSEDVSLNAKAPECDATCRAQATPDHCLSTRDYFDTVAFPQAVQRCLVCHQAGGQAGGSRYVMKGPAIPNALALNYEAFAAAAKLEANGQKLVLLKPTLSVPHTGGRVVEPGSVEYAVLVEMVARLATPVTCPDDVDPVPTDVLEGVELLDAWGTLRKAALQLAGRLPTDAEAAAVQAGGLEAVDAAVLAMTKEPAFLERVREIFNDVLLTDAYTIDNGHAALVSNWQLDTAIFPEAKRYQSDALYASCQAGSSGCPKPTDRELIQTSNAIAREPVEFFAWAVRENRSLGEVLTAKHRLVNAWGAKLFGLGWDGKAAGTYDPGAYDPHDYRPAAIPGLNENLPGEPEAYSEYAGILTTNAYRARYPNTCTNNNRKIARYTYKYFQDFDIMKSAPRLDLSSVDLSAHPSRTNPQCTGCHVAIDPVAGAFQNWTPCSNSPPRYYPPSKRANCGVGGWKGDDEMFPPGVGAGPELVLPPESRGHGLEALAAHFVAQPGFASAMVRHVFTGLTGRPPLEPPPDPNAAGYAAADAAYELQKKTLASLVDTFVKGGLKLPPLVVALVRTPTFRARNADRADRGELDALGGGVWTPPEVLHRKLVAVFGSGWDELFQDAHGGGLGNAPDMGYGHLQRRDRARLFAGGIDSQVVTTRQRLPSGLASGVMERMALELSCLHVGRDFTRADADRRLFQGLSLTLAPSGDPAAADQAPIVATIRRLHERLLGERLEANDPEVLATYQLLGDAWAQARTDGDLPKICGGTYDLRTAEPTAAGTALPAGSAPGVRAWQAVIVYLLTDYRFLFQ